MSLQTEAVILSKPEPLDSVPEVKLDPPPNSAIAPPSRLARASAPAKTEHDEDDSDEDDGGGSTWETSSVIEQFLDDVSPPEYSSGKAILLSYPNVCTPEEVRSYKSLLHQLGLEDFVQETLGKGTITARKLCSAFNVRIPPWLECVDTDASFLRLLGLALVRELTKRQRLAQYNSIDDAVKLLQSAKNVLVVTGAGISTSLGIPDFRSKHTGFYTKLRERGYEEPEEVFELSLFDEDPTVFYGLAGDILPDLHRYSPTHQFIRVLQDQNKLLRNYTQNIDNIEAHAGVMREKLIQCHGSWATATCRKCGYQLPGEEIFESVQKKEVAKCTRCVNPLSLPRAQGMKRKRSNNGIPKSRRRSRDDSDDDSDYDIPEPGVMKPDITFFGERLPDTFFNKIQEDRASADLVIVMGTSMKVAPVSEIPGFVPPHVPQIYISRDPIYHINFDINLLGDCDTIVAELCRRAGWPLNHDMVPDDQKVEVLPYDKHDPDMHVWSVRAKARDGVATSSLPPRKTQSDQINTNLANGSVTAPEGHSKSSSSRNRATAQDGYPYDRPKIKPPSRPPSRTSSKRIVIEID